MSSLEPAGVSGPVDGSRSPYARLRTLAHATSRPATGFWAERQRVNREVSLLRGHAMLERAGNLSMLAAAAAGERRELDIVRFPPFLDTDVFKWLEAVAWSADERLAPRVEHAADEAIGLVERAQAPDGYLNSFYQVAFPHLRFSDLAYSHELYNAGHLIQAALAWQRVRGDARLLRVATRFVDLIDSTFGPTGRLEPDGHPGVETALAELYRETGEPRYLELARFFLDQRGQGLLGDNAGRWFFGGRDYFQDRLPVREASTLAGHAVRALYLATGMVDVYLEGGDRALLRASERQWRDLVEGKLYITGGIGQRPETEGFGEPYELPPDRGYCETCAAVASVHWSWRLLLATGKARYAELMERTLYNGVLVGGSVDGGSFFYANKLLDDGSHRRAQWYHVACCPPNLMRLVASIGDYAATVDDGGVQVHQYLDAALTAMIPRGEVRLELSTEVPWDGATTVSVLDSPREAWTLSLRVPDWAGEASVMVADAAPRPVRAGAYARVHRRWRAGDRIRLALPMRPRFSESHPRVEATRGQVALERGPLVYCFEACDQDEGVDLAAAAVGARPSVREERRPGWAGGVTWLHVAGRSTRLPRGGALYRPAGAGPVSSLGRFELHALPYYLWANRTPGAMRVWLPRIGSGRVR